MYQIREANQMVEEFMLAANVSVAEKILSHFSSCSLLRWRFFRFHPFLGYSCPYHLAIFICGFFSGRRHPTPTREMLEPLLRTAAAVGLSLDVSSSKALADSLDHAIVRLIFISNHCPLTPTNYLFYWRLFFQGPDPYFNKLIRILATRCMTQVIDYLI